MADDNIYTEQELSKMADELLNAAGETELLPEPPKTKKSSRKKADPAESSKTPEERLNELFEKGKKTGKLTPKELELLEELNLDGEAVDRFYETLERASISTSAATICSRLWTMPCPRPRIWPISRRSQAPISPIPTP